MRHIITLILTLLISVVSFGQLKADALTIKDKSPKEYANIRENAVSEWSGDNSMIVYEINGQCEALIEFLTLSRDDKSDVPNYAMLEWKKGKTYDWKMVLYEYKNQLKNSDY